MCRAIRILPLLVVIAFVGCDAPQSSFVYNEQTEALPQIAQTGGKTKEGQEFKGIKNIIEENFGTPHDLVAWAKLPVNYGGMPNTEAAEDPASFSLADASDEQLAEYEKTPGFHLAAGRALYMEHCLHCHGTSGDGAGPTAEYLNPLPRDYRNGVFKFTSTKEGKTATREDLTRVIKMGIAGTYMPSFMLLEDQEVDQIVEYVRWLSMRGQLENALGAELAGNYSAEAMAERIDGGENRNEIMSELREELVALPETADGLAGDIADAWDEAESTEALIVPSVGHIEDSEESRRRGRAVFISAAAKCTNCHGSQGLGNGKQTEEYEANAATGEKWPEKGLHDMWGHIIKPRNLTRGIYRGGRRPIDVFRRVRAGVKGSGMPAFSTAVISDEDLWHLVNYVKSIPFGQTAPAAPEKASEPAG
ncbi:MAG: cytochrome c [Planctomycetaceae bacterium]